MGRSERGGTRGAGWDGQVRGTMVASRPSPSGMTVVEGLLYAPHETMSFGAVTE